MAWTKRFLIAIVTLSAMQIIGAAAAPTSCAKGTTSSESQPIFPAIPAAHRDDSSQHFACSSSFVLHLPDLRSLTDAEYREYYQSKLRDIAIGVVEGVPGDRVKSERKQLEKTLSDFHISLSQFHPVENGYIRYTPHSKFAQTYYFKPMPNDQSVFLSCWETGIVVNPRCSRITMWPNGIRATYSFDAKYATMADSIDLRLRAKFK